MKSPSKPSYKVALVDDDVNLLDILEMLLVETGKFEVVKYISGLEAMRRIPQLDFDLAIIDLHLENIVGKNIVENLRSKGIKIPLIMLTASESNANLIECLDAGADDYVTKPFDSQVLLARIDAVMRRTADLEDNEELLKIADVEINQQTHVVTRDSKLIELTPLEYKLLVYLVNHKNKVISRDRLLEDVWDYNAEIQTRVVDVHIANLRKKLNENHPNDIEIVTTIRGFGYRVMGDS